MDDFLLMASSEEEAYKLRQRVERVLNRLGLKRNEKKGQWVPVQVYWPLDDDWYKGTVTDVAGTGQHHIQYDNGAKEWLQLLEEMTRPERQEAEEDNDVAPVDEWTSALRDAEVSWA
ncbi:hypothetical protein CYMTET_52792 [Cymbomonas tetramitiformis]|uniref:Reverse transcriptase domain-containing protein n=1 Tax=Cymbomonas tetramitiformis TaxID=36881 RepID=A0AAE0EQQ7_9CHLO|nr:hypothetical protein CYMTET_52792 [Cymbomonas tetramitiformis]